MGVSIRQRAASNRHAGCHRDAVPGRDVSPIVPCEYPQTAGASLSPAGQVSNLAAYNRDSCNFPLMVTNGDQGAFRQQLWFQVTQPKVFAKAVPGHSFDPAVFAVGSRVVDCTVDEVVQTCQYTQGAGQPVIAQAAC